MDLDNKRERAREILARLEKLYPQPRTALKFTTPFELLVATILSAQTTDAHVNKVTERLFKKYKTIQDYANTPLEVFQRDISSINFYRNKAKNIIGAAKMIIEKFNSQVPQTMEELIKLPGVARKTANIILFNVFGKNEGVAVDTHVRRLSKRLGLTESDNPGEIEQDLMKIVPQEEWGNFSHLLILHGRKICTARNPKHQECVLYDICPSKDI